MRRTIVPFITLAVAGAFLTLSAQEVRKYSGEEASLGKRWAWGVGEASKVAAGKEFWLGYSIKRLMNEDSYFLSGNIVSGSAGTRLSLYDVLHLPKPEDVDRGSGARSGGGMSVYKHLKDVALLFRCSILPSGGVAVENVDLCTMDLSTDLKKMPVFWMGSSDDRQSVELLKTVYATTSTSDAKKSLVQAVGIHQMSDEVYPTLKDILKSADPDEVRARAAFWIGEQHQATGLPLLLDVAQHDRSVKVREQAVFAISRIDDEASTDALIALVRKLDDTKVRARAAFWLGQKASQKAVSTLEDVIQGDDDSDVQRQALYGLSNSKDSVAIDRLIRIAQTHPNPRIRKQAIQILGQTDDPKALEALIDFVKK